MLNKVCGFRDPTRQICQILNTHTEEDCKCPYYQAELLVCPLCQKTIVGKGMLIQNSHNEWITVCGDCASQTGTCVTCAQARKCAFKEDTSLPDFVIETKQMGPVTQQIQIPNPVKIRKNCENCSCFSSGKFGCLKQNGCCENYKESF